MCLIGRFECSLQLGNVLSAFDKDLCNVAYDDLGVIARWCGYRLAMSQIVVDGIDAYADWH